MSSKFNFKKKDYGKIMTLRPSSALYDEILAITIAEGVNVPSVALELLRVGVEEYKKEKNK